MSTVNGKHVAAQGTWLDTCRAAGADVPALCHHDPLGPGGRCGACMIEVDGRMVRACATPANEGRDAVTDGPALREYRRDLGELMLSEGAPAGDAGKLVAAWGADGSRYGHAPRDDRHDASHPAVRFDARHCILCRRCLEACAFVAGEFVFAIEGRGAGTRLAWGGGPLADTSCVSCGACVTACPSGALTAKPGADR